MKTSKFVLLIVIIFGASLYGATTGRTCYAVPWGLYETSDGDKFGKRNYFSGGAWCHAKPEGTACMEVNWTLTYKLKINMSECDDTWNVRPDYYDNITTKQAKSMNDILVVEFITNLDR